MDFHQIYYAFIRARSRLGLLHINFYKFVTELWPLINCFYIMKSAAAGL